jgi:hypothetical protein
LIEHEVVYLTAHGRRIQTLAEGSGDLSRQIFASLRINDPLSRKLDRVIPLLNAVVWQHEEVQETDAPASLADTGLQVAELPLNLDAHVLNFLTVLLEQALGAHIELSRFDLKD